MDISPRQLQEKINAISDEYFEKCQEMADIAAREDEEWLRVRKICKTNGEADRLWGATADGQRQKYLTWYIKGLSAKRAAFILEHRMNQNL